MKIMNYSEYKKLKQAAQAEDTSAELIEKVGAIIQEVKTDGDKAIKKYTALYDGVELERLAVDKSAIETAWSSLDRKILDAMKFSAHNIKTFAKRQLQQLKDFKIEIQKGVWAGQRVAPIHRAAIYVPGGRFSLPSSALMGLIPAKVAGVKELYVFTPPQKNASVDSAILTASKMLDVKKVYAVGGVQAVAAAAYGTEAIPKMDIIVGPGNRYVTEAKRQVYGDIGIDFIAGPSEVVIVADDTANPDYIAADLLAQAEHDPDTIPILITISQELAGIVKKKIYERLAMLKIQNIAEQSVTNNGKIILCDELIQCIEVTNDLAPEHLELHGASSIKRQDEFTNFGSLFLGENSMESLGDYTAGINHILPTGGAARYTSGLSVMNFVRLQTILEVSREGLKQIGDAAVSLGDFEGLEAHAKSVRSRVKVE